MKANPIRLLHVITGLQLGGAEMTLYRLMSRIDRNRFSVHVISLGADGVMASLLRDTGVEVRSLGMNSGVPDPRAFMRLRSWIREIEPDVVQTWLYHADLLGGLAAASLGIPVIWNLRQSDLSRRGNKRGTLLTARVCASLSRWLPDRIVCCSHATCRTHHDIGYAREKLTVIPNGFDTDQFRPNPASRARIRRALGISESVRLVGLVARFHVQKDHRNFFAACARFASDPSVHFLLCGTGVDTTNRELVAWMRLSGIANRCHLLGVRFDIPEIMASLDVAVSSSFGEGFPNAVGEAMACGVPCVTTDAGDCASMVSDAGYVVPVGNPDALASAISRVLAMPEETRRELGMAGRQRVMERFNLALATRAYERMYQETASAADLVPVCLP